MRILLLGKSGLIGHAIADAASSGGFEILCPGRTTAPALDLENLDHIEALPLDGIDTVVHAAGVTDEEVKASPSRAIIRATVTTARLLERCSQAGIKRFAYVSSSHVYGPFEGTKTERSSADPLSDYAMCHYGVEQSIRRALKKFGGSALFIRPNAVFGMPPEPSLFTRWSLIPYEFPRDLIEKGVIGIRSSGEQARNFISVEDIADGTVAWLRERAKEGVTIWNPVGPLTCSVYEFGLICKEVLQQTTNKPGRVERGTEAAPGADFRLESEWRLTKPDRRPEPFLSEIYSWLLSRA